MHPAHALARGQDVADADVAVLVVDPELNVVSATTSTEDRVIFGVNARLAGMYDALRLEGLDEARRDYLTERITGLLTQPRILSYRFRETARCYGPAQSR